jgi:Tol biopolymer transport system component
VPSVIDCRPTAFDRIVFESDRTGNWEIFTMNPDGSDLQQATDDETYDFWAELAPDGASIAWTAYRDGGNTTGDIYVSNVDGTNPRNMTNSPANDYLPAWSPDGTSIAFVSNRDGSLDIWTIDVGSGTTRQITNVSSADLEPDWTSDGSLVYSSFRSGDGQHLFVQRIGDPTATQLTFGNLFLEEGPEISPDGTTIVYRRYNVAPEGVYLLPVGGGTPVNLTSDVGANPAWSPDGTRIVYHRADDIYVMNADGSSPINLTQSDWSDRRPHWGPSAPQ